MNIRATYVVLSATLATFTSIAAGDTFGDTFQFGGMVGVSYPVVLDPKGDSTGSLGAVYALVATQAMERDGRILYHLFYETFRTEADVDSVGQRGERFGAQLSYQYTLRAARTWKPWIGAGLSLTDEKYKKRHVVDGEGFLAQRFPTRERTGYGVVVNTTTEWEVKNWTVGLHINYEHPFGHGVRAWSVAGVVLW
jgi:hypothetical protein